MKKATPLPTVSIRLSPKILAEAARKAKSLGIERGALFRKAICLFLEIDEPTTAEGFKSLSAKRLRDIAESGGKAKAAAGKIPK